MTIGFLFWLIMVVTLLFGGWFQFSSPNGRSSGLAGMSLLIWVLLFLLGWKVFGFVIQG